MKQAEHSSWSDKAFSTTIYFFIEFR